MPLWIYLSDVIARRGPKVANMVLRYFLTYVLSARWFEKGLMGIYYSLQRVNCLQIVVE